MMYKYEKGYSLSLEKQSSEMIRINFIDQSTPKQLTSFSNLEKNSI